MNAQMAKRLNKQQKQIDELKTNSNYMNTAIYALSELAVEIVRAGEVELRSENAREFVKQWKLINGDKDIVSGRFDDDNSN